MTMKITRQKAAKAVVIEVVGTLVGPWVKELEQCWRAANGSKVRVDLTGVTFIDEAGTDLLRTMHREHVEFVAEGCFIEGIVDGITQPNQQGRTA
jgi:anti-anti-sigma regulatory factor